MKKLSDKISVIVPVYNVEQYLAECIQSITKQSYQNLEIILVDDGSNDHSLAICEHFQQQDSRIRVIHQHNQGTGAARNTGVNVASGNYLLFVDGDDLIGADHVKHLYDLSQQTQADIACDLMYRMDNAGTYYFFVNHAQDDFNGTYHPAEWVSLELTKPPYFVYLASWAKLIKRSLFNNIEFPNNSFAEDAATMWKLYLAANQIAFLNEGDYCYRIRNNSSSNHGGHHHHAMLMNDLKTLEERIQFFHVCQIPINFLFQRYHQALHELSSIASDYHSNYDRLNAQTKLTILNKYHK